MAALAVLEAEDRGCRMIHGMQRDLWWLNTTAGAGVGFTDGEMRYPVRGDAVRGMAWRTGEILGTAERLDDGRLRVSLDGAWRTVSGDAGCSTW